MQLDDALTSRDVINTKLREILDDATDKWGTRVVRVEIQRIDPPPDVVDAMHHQMKAERTRRAVVTEALGVREAAVTRAEGDKQAAVLEATGQAEAVQRMADAEKYRQIAVAEGEAEATRSVYRAIHDGDPSPDLVAIKYLEALRVVANGQATKIFLPTELSGLFGAAGGLAEMLRSDGQAAETPSPDAQPAPAKSPA
jgi:regulator of protease activity HflC (stomatin/prohibitin superfamily)